MPDGTFFPVAQPPTKAPVEPTAHIDLRPLTTSELIDRGFALYRAHFTGFLLLALLAQTAPLLSQILITAARLNPSQADVEHPAKIAEKIALIGIISIVSQVIVFGFEVIATFFIADAYHGRIPSVSASLRKFAALAPASVWTCLLSRFLIALTFLFPAAVLGAVYFYLLREPPIHFGPVVEFAVVTLLLLVASLVPVLVVFMRLWVIVPPLALEGLSGVAAIRRSSALVRFDPGLGFLYWGEMRLSFLLLPLFVIELLILMLTSLPLIIFQVGEAIRHGSGGPLVTPPDTTVILSQILTFLAGSLIWPLYAIATALFYYDVRIRREGFDLEFMAQRLGESK